MDSIADPRDHILDIHTHHLPPEPEAVVSVRITSGFNKSDLLAGQLYSVGIHPWDTVDDNSSDLTGILEDAASMSEIVAIGECGVDIPKGGPLFRQLQIFKAHVEISEKLRKPLIIHDVKAHDIIVGLHRDLTPSMPWIIHGFRGKPQVAEMLLRAGCMISLGEKFNPDTLRIIPEDRLLAETDESELSIQEIIGNMEKETGKNLTDLILSNTRRILYL